MRVLVSAFDSQQYGLHIGRAMAEPSDRIADLEAAMALAQPPFDVVFVRTPTESLLDSDLRRRGHAPADVLVTSTLTDSPEATVVPTSRFAIETHDRVSDHQDLAAIEAISASVLRRSHLHSDPRLPMEITRRYYAAWARNNATGRARQTVLARADQTVIGYLSILHRTPPATPIASPSADRVQVVIDLIAVDAAWQGQGVGAALLTTLAAWLAARPGAVATVGTQADNPALKLYRRFGYLPTERQATYHVWRPPRVSS